MMFFVTVSHAERINKHFSNFNLQRLVFVIIYIYSVAGDGRGSRDILWECKTPMTIIIGRNSASYLCGL